MLCVKCNAQLKENARFCPACGSPVASVAPPPIPQAAPAPPPPPVPQAAPAPPSPPVPQAAPAPPSPPKQRPQIPAGFELDPDSGLYYTAEAGAHPVTKAPGLWVTYFHPVYGDYKKAFYANGGA
jgi:hypothetical protein